MHLYQVAIIVILVILWLFSRDNGEVLSIVVLHATSIAMYYFISESHYNYYYTTMCFVLLVVGKSLFTRFKVASICAYILVPVNALGYLLWHKFYPHDLYNAISATILIIQFLSILPKALFNGMDTAINRYSMAGGSRFDGNKECDTMHKIPPTKKDKR